MTSWIFNELQDRELSECFSMLNYRERYRDETRSHFSRFSNSNVLTTLIIGIIMGNQRFDTWLIQVIGPVYDPQSVFLDRKKKRFMQTKSVLQTKNRSGPAKNRFSVALGTANKQFFILGLITMFPLIHLWGVKSFSRQSNFCIEVIYTCFMQFGKWKKEACFRIFLFHLLTLVKKDLPKLTKISTWSFNCH